MKIYFCVTYLSRDDSSNESPYVIDDDPELCSTMYDDEEPILENIQRDDLEQLFNVNHIAFGPHLKLSRGDELYGMEEECSMVHERKFVCAHIKKSEMCKSL